MSAILIKLYMAVAEFLGRLFIFNRNLPDGYLKTSNIRYSDKGRLDIFKPTEFAGKLPVLIYIHGGGWTTGSKLSGTRQCAVISREGFLVLNIKYRLGPRYTHPAQIEDIGNVLKWLNENKEIYDADANRIFFGGSSAGAHLSCLSACIASNPVLRNKIGVPFPIEASQIAGLLLVYGGYNMETIVDTGFFMIRTMVSSYTGTRNISSYGKLDEISPVHHVTSDFPPAFLAVGERDKLFSQTQELIAILEKQGLPHDKLLYDKSIRGGKHGFWHRHYRSCAIETYERIIKFMKEYSKTMDNK